MTGRERLNAVLHQRRKDRLPWTTLVDEAALALQPEELRGNGGMDFYRHLGCDVFLLNGWGTEHTFDSPRLCWPDTVEVVRRAEPGRTTVEWRTPKRVLTQVSQNGHPVKYPVDSLEAVQTYRELWEGVSFQADFAKDQATLSALNRLINDDGVVTRFWGSSTIPRLLEEDMGAENFYYLMADHPEEVEGLITTIHEQELEAFRILSEGPWDSVTLIENTSTFYISPDIYKRFNMPHQRAFVEQVKSQGKVALLHMCGHVHGLLDLIKETRCDGIHTLTPSPTGDTPWEEALDVLGEDLIILGCLDPSTWITGPLKDIPATLDRLITPRLREANFILNPMADGIPVEPARFAAVATWVRANSPVTEQWKN
jgi:hypothetical protein